MKQYIDKDALVAEIEKRINKEIQSCATDSILGYSQGCIDSMRNVLSLINTLEVKEIHEDIDVDLNPLFEEFGVEPDSRFASMFKEAFYKGVDKYLNKKENKL